MILKFQPSSLPKSSSVRFHYFAVQRFRRWIVILLTIFFSWNLGGIFSICFSLMNFLPLIIFIYWDFFVDGLQIADKIGKNLVFNACCKSCFEDLYGFWYAWKLWIFRLSFLGWPCLCLNKNWGVFFFGDGLRDFNIFCENLILILKSIVSKIYAQMVNLGFLAMACNVNMLYSTIKLKICEFFGRIKLKNLHLF
jgi:hypothetical protein